MTWTVGCQLLAFVFYFLYASFFEWAFHKHLFHSPRYVKATFKAHTLVHHQRYKYAPESYQSRDDDNKEHVTMDWFALPLFIGVHLPLFIVVQWVTGIPSIWGGLGAVVAYYTVYEYFHYCMHIPGKRWFERNPVFRFVKEHHRIHHKHMQKNLNVFFPLADLCLGTFISQKREMTRELEKAAASASAATTVKQTATQKTH